MYNYSGEESNLKRRIPKILSKDMDHKTVWSLKMIPWRTLNLPELYYFPFSCFKVILWKEVAICTAVYQTNLSILKYNSITFKEIISQLHCVWHQQWHQWTLSIHKTHILGVILLLLFLHQLTQVILFNNYLLRSNYEDTHTKRHSSWHLQ